MLKLKRSKAGMMKFFTSKHKKEGVSFFDVKELYDAAYTEKAKVRVSIKCFQALLAEAVRLDEVYRAQLLPTGQKQKYRRVA